MLLQSDTPGFNALVAPGHVSTVMGPEEWAFVPEQYGIPAAVAGFTSESLIAALYSVLRQVVSDRCFLDNCYPEVVRPGGNPAARRQLDVTMEVVDANWRGIGIIPASGYALRPEFAAHDAYTTLSLVRRRCTQARGTNAAGLRLRARSARSDLSRSMCAIWARLHAAHAGWTVHGVG